MIESNHRHEQITSAGWLRREWTLILAAVSTVMQVVLAYVYFATR